MPELPEVETVVRYLAPNLRGRSIAAIELRRPDLRYAIPVAEVMALRGGQIVEVRRRAKYLLMDVIAAQGRQVALIHLGMSGQLILCDSAPTWARHEHWRMALGPADGGAVLRYIDARRFGALDVMAATAESGHRLLRQIGVEPLEPAFSSTWLHAQTRGGRAAIKTWIMDGRKIAGVGNIYASEALYRARLRPTRPAGSLSRPAAAALVAGIKSVLNDAIADGGTSLRDFVQGDASPGYFKQRLDVYDRADAPCRRCAAAAAGAESRIARTVMLGRATYHCPRCQR